MASLEKNEDPDEISLITKVDAKKSLQISSCQSSPNKRKDSLGKIEKYILLYIKFHAFRFILLILYFQL